MKNALMTLAVFSLLGAAVCSPPAHSIYASPSKINAQERKELVEKLELETIALVRSNEKGTFEPYCSGVWVDVDKIMTAFHCIKSESLENGMLLNLFLYQVIDDNVSYGRPSVVVKIDEENDLALLETDLKTTPEHPVALIADESWDGEHVNIVGHTNGLWWTYIEGVISSTRAEAVKGEKPQLVLQISAPAWYGNSGGGAFDDEGKLLGISSFISVKAPMMSFFVHRNILKNLISKK